MSIENMPFNETTSRSSKFFTSKKMTKYAGHMIKSMNNRNMKTVSHFI